jgi:hypothetical protein
MKRLTALGVAVLLGLSACQTGRVSSPAGVPLEETEAGKARMHQQAVDALARWDAAYAAAKQPVFAPLSDFEPGVVGLGPTETEKEFLYYGMGIVLDAALPSDIPDKAELRWASGATRSITVASADATFTAMVTRLRANCGGCTPSQSFHVTGARPTTVTIDTVDGAVTAPAWEYTLAGYSARLVMPSVAPGEALVPPIAPWDSAHPPLGLMFSTVKSTSDGTRLTVGFVGAKGHADEPCGVDYTAEAVAGTHAVVIIIYTQRYHGSAGQNLSCDMIGYGREVMVTLNPPLGNRIVLDGLVGHPFAVTKE